ncbi:MAG: efflux RND transporter periplasmic adaptor subunit [Tannerellaceae bacterium]|jgi:HlyD family secretion protein|nr:efflux RND transporter periplasmic adaptor subunit [Tannerellaceae bacterium]
MKTKKKIILWTAIAIVIALFAIYIAGKGKSAAAGAYRLETARAERSTMINAITATGTVEPVITVEVGTQVSGIISKLYVDYNDVVTRGQLLAEMDKVNLEAELAAKEADLAASRSQFDYQEKNYNRSRSLHEKQLISESDFETATYNYLQAKSSYDRLRSDMIRVRRNLEYAIITSPIDGVVVKRAVEQGQTVAAGFSTPTLFTIANDLTQMRVIANVDEADIGEVQEGQNVTFTVDAYPEDTFEGRVTQVRLEATVTANVVTYSVVISAPNPDLKLKPGLTANVSIRTLERPAVLALPYKALRFVPDNAMLKAMNLTADEAAEAPEGKKIVWQREGNSLKPREIRIGASTINAVEILEGLTEGEEIITDLLVDMPARAQAPGGLFGPPAPRGGGRR